MEQQLHPRPQMTRTRWTDLCGPWRFAHDDANIGLDEGWQGRADIFDREIIVPFPPESQASGIGDTYFHPYVWYRRTFEVPAEDRSGRLLLHFGAVDYRARVWVNGQLVADHEGGHTRFTADITSALVNGEQVVVVRAEDQPRDLSQPRGKQDWEPAPHRIWYHRTTGIWQPVWLEPVPNLSISNVRWTPDLDRGTLALLVCLSNQPMHPVRLRVRLSLHGIELANDTFTLAHRETRRDLSLETADITMSRDRTLWSPRSPNLIDAEIELLNGDVTVDTVMSYAGLRSSGFADGRFMLNGRPTYLRMVLAQNYWPESHLAAPSEDALRREVELIKKLGFNGVRIHQKVEDPRFLYWCDRLGLMVWGEMANAYTFSPDAVDKFTREWLEVLQRDHSHPSVVAWVPFNESWGVPNMERSAAQRDFVRALYYLTKAIDPSRPAIGNDGWEHLIGDVWGVHDYALDGETLRERYGSFDALERTIREVRPHDRTIAFPDSKRNGEPIMLTEFGGISYTPRPGTVWFGYGTVTTSDAFLEKYDELVSAILDSPAIAGYCYTQLTDTEQETNGLLTEDRTPKLDMDAIRAINQQPSKAMPSEVIRQIQYAAEVTSFEGTG
ncbi:MAG TPA: glycoside hydrolase family 2 TIM barrel-domain containing protein [Thermomicrobiales bacterium]|nr:glycoside hydrolase family 2 TIM barrel-domain containing protein [Thermomicrobiales bacterium]